VAALVTTLACHSAPPPPARQAVGWHLVRSWSGRGNSQTESFESASGQLRIRWHASAEGSPGGSAGLFRLTAHSAISGRPLQVAVDQLGPGEGTAYVDQDPHDFYFAVESANLDWSFTVEDSVSGTLQEASPTRRP